MDESSFLDLTKMIQHSWMVDRLILNLVSSIQDNVSVSLTEITEGLTKMGVLTALGREKAEAKFEQTYLDPNQDQLAKTQQVQGQVDDIIEQMLNEGNELECEIDQSGSEFAKSLEAVSILDANISKILFELMGSLSAEDVISQRIQTLATIIKTKQEFLKKFLDVDVTRLNAPQIASWMESLNEFSQKQFKTAEEARFYNQTVAKSAPFPDSQNPSKTNLRILDYIRNFALLQSFLLTSVEKLFVKAIEQANNAIFSLDASAQDSQNHASSKMLKQDNGEFSNTVVKNEQMGSAQKYLEQISSQISSDIFGMMGILSVGDVVGQRLQTAAQLSTELSSVVKVYHNSLAGNEPETPESLLNASISRSKQFFTNEQDKQIFKSVFFHQKQSA